MSAAVDEAIRFLRRAHPLARSLSPTGSRMAAAEHVAEQAAGGFGHRGSDRSDPGERMNRHGIWSGRWGENISYGKSTARDIVIALIIDDGLRSRKHRKNIFNPDFQCGRRGGRIACALRDGLQYRFRGRLRRSAQRRICRRFALRSASQRARRDSLTAMLTPALRRANRYNGWPSRRARFKYRASLWPSPINPNPPSARAARKIFPSGTSRSSRPPTWRNRATCAAAW